MTFQAAIFDLDGTLLDTETLDFQAASEALEAQGFTLTHAQYGMFIGNASDVNIRKLAQVFPGVDAEAAQALWTRRALELYAGPIDLRPTAEQLLTKLTDLGVPIAIATSSRRVSVDLKLSNTGLDRWFDTTVSVDDVTNPKPAPEPYLRAAQLLGVAPEACIAFEDSNTGAQAAYAAGMTVVQVPDLAPASGDYAHFVAGTLMEGAKVAGLLTPDTAQV